MQTNKKTQGKKNKRGKKYLLPKICPVCKKEFRPTWHGQIHCNINCYAKSEKLKRNASNSFLIKNNKLAKWREGTGGKSFQNKTTFKKNDIRLIGKKNVNWKDGISTLASKIRRIKEYLYWKSAILERDAENFKNLQVHHLIPFNKILEDNNIKSIEEARNCEALWDLNNGVTLRKAEHNIITQLERIKSGHSKAFLNILEEVLKKEKRRNNKEFK